MMISLKQSLLLWTISFFSFFAGTTFATEGSNTSDLLDQAFQPAVQMQTVISAEEALGQKGSFILKGKTEVNINKNGVSGNTKPSLLVQITQGLLTATIVLSITMLIYNGIQYMIKSSKGENPKEVVSNILWIAGGILLALLSLMIVKFAASIGATTIGIT